MPTTAAKRTPRKNGNGDGPLTNEERMILLAAASRASLAARLGKSYENTRDLYVALGYNRNPDYTDYLSRYQRQDIAKAVVDAPVRASWRNPPAVSEAGVEGESEFDRQWQGLAERRKLYHYFSRVDRLASIGQYAALLIGFDDGKPPEQPVTRAADVLYVMPYGQGNAAVASEVKDPKDPRYGLPEFYSILLRTSSASSEASTSIKVHWSRVIHVSEDNLESDTYGSSRLEAILNRLEDLERVAGGSSEMFWRGAFPGYGFQLAENASIGQQTLDELGTEIEDYMHGLKRYLRLQGVEIKDMAMQVAEPTAHFQMLVDLISAATRIPKRILLGSERGELASSQDQRNWASRIEERRLEHCEPVIMRPFIDRMIEVGVLPKPDGGYTVKWPDLLLLTKKERAQVGEVMSRAVKNYLLSGEGASMVPPELFLEIFLGLDQAEVEKAKVLLPMLRRPGGGSPPPPNTEPAA